MTSLAYTAAMPAAAMLQAAVHSWCDNVAMNVHTCASGLNTHTVLAATQEFFEAWSAQLS